MVDGLGNWPKIIQHHSRVHILKLCWVVHLLKLNGTVCCVCAVLQFLLPFQLYTCRTVKDEMRSV